jgi:tetratricopeptide (TPR) repeat protein
LTYGSQTDGESSRLNSSAEFAVQQMPLPMVFTHSSLQWLHRSGGIVLLLTMITCAPDPAEQAYREALRGEENGTTREEQIALLNRAIELAPNRVSYWNTHAIYSIDQRNFVQAQRDLERAISLADRPYLRYLRGLVLCQQGQYRAALPDLDLAISQQPENSQFYHGRALAYVELGEVQKALMDADHLVAVEPNFGPAYYVRGRARAIAGRYREEIADYNETLHRRPELVYPLFARAASYERLGDWRQAAIDRNLANAKVPQKSGCGNCYDPFRS